MSLLKLAEIIKRNCIVKWKEKVSGKGCLTDKAIKTQQKYYGIPIGANASDVNAMKRAVGAVPHHCSHLPWESEHHKLCPKSENSWCKWQSEKITGKQEHKKKLSFSPAIKEKL